MRDIIPMALLLFGPLFVVVAVVFIANDAWEWLWVLGVVFIWWANTFFGEK